MMQSVQYTPRMVDRFGLRLPTLVLPWRSWWAWLTRHETQTMPLPWATLWRLVLPLWLSTRLLLLAETYVAQTLLRPVVIQQPHSYPPSLVSMLSSWALWDGKFYRRVLLAGYQQPLDASTWPLYPLLAKPFELLLGADHWQIALLMVSNAATLIAFLLLGALALQEDGTLNSARRATLLLAAAPLAFFLSATYTDSLFLALTAAVLLCARRGQWRLVALCAFCAALTRPVGVVLIAPILWEYGRQHEWGKSWDWRSLLRMRILTGALMVASAVPLAVALFSLFCWHVYGDPLAWLHREAAFGHRAMAPWSAIALAWQQFTQFAPASFQQSRNLIDDGTLALVLLFTVVTLRHIPASFTLLLVGLLLVGTTAPILGTQFPEVFPSLGRYLLPAVPVYLGLARLLQRYPWLETSLIGGGFALQALLVAFVINGGWLV